MPSTTFLQSSARLQALELLALQLGERVLEIGFGTGNELADMAAAAA